MSLTFLAPLFLVGLAAIAVPVIVHLVNRERRNSVAFPSLMFLRRVPFKSVRRQRIRHRALFALRCLALALLALAFARPFVDRGARAATATGAGPRELVILLDRSYSMAYGDRWARASEAAVRALADVGSSDRATLVLFDDEAAATTGDPALVRTAIQNARPGSGSTRYAPALAVAQQLVDRSERPRREVVLISDFQRTGWDGEELPRLVSPATLTPINVGDTATTNVLVAGVDVTREAREGVDRAIVAARVARQGAGSAGTTQAALEINGRVVETKQVTLPGNGAASVTFSAFPVPDGTARGTVRVTSSGERLSVDDAFNFVIGAAQVVNVLLIESPAAPVSRTMFLPRALALGDRPAFRVVQRRSDQVTAADVEAARVVLLHGAAMPGGTIGDRIRNLVRSGGGLVVALGESNGARALSGASEMLPGEIGGIVDRSLERGGTLGSLDRNHSALETFRAARSGDFTTTRYMRYRELTPGPTDAVLARFDDGKVALAERRVGDGTVMVFSSTFDGYWNDLPVQPVFLPLVQSIVRYAAHWTAQPAWETVGNMVSVAAPSGGGEQTATSPSGERQRWSAADSMRSLALREQGFYEIRNGDGPAVSRTIAVNPNRAESELGSFSPDELARAVAPANAVNTIAANSTTSSAEERERHQTLWWYVLVVALLLLGAESLLSNRLSRATRRDTPIDGRLENA